LAGEGKLWPVIDQVVPWQRAPEAFERLARGDQIGKIVIEVAQ
jgi:NADPH:quinone reductase